MPKHRITNEDMFIPKICPICNNDVFEEKDETCSWECERILDIFKQDMDESFYEDEGLYGDF